MVCLQARNAGNHAFGMGGVADRRRGTHRISRALEVSDVDYSCI